MGRRNYIKQLGQVSAGEILLHRMLWCPVFLALVLTWQGCWTWPGRALRQPKKYVAPTLQLLLGTLYGEPLAGPKLAGYVLVWAALALYSAAGLWQSRRPTAAPG